MFTVYSQSKDIMLVGFMARALKYIYKKTKGEMEFMKKKLLSVLLSVAMVATMLAGCGSKEEPAAEEPTVTEETAEEPAAEEPATEEPAAEESAAGGINYKMNSGATDELELPEGTYIAIVSKGFMHQYWQAVKAGAEVAADELGVEITFEGPETEAMIDQQIEMIDAALAKNPAALCLAALDTQAASSQLDAAVAANIPVIAFDSGVDSDIIVSTAATNNKAAAAEAAKQLCELIGDEGKVAILVHDQTSVTGIDRRDGFLEEIENNHPNVEVVDVSYGEGDHIKSTDAANAVLAANPDLKGYFGANEGSIAGVLNALEESGRSEVVAVGFDSGKQQIDAINNGTEAGVISQDPYGMGYATVVAAARAILGLDNDKFIDTGFQWVTTDNINDANIQMIMYE